MAQWMVQLGQDGRHSVELSDYAHLFARNNITGALLLQLRQDDLRRLGISSMGHAIEIYVGILQNMEN